MDARTVARRRADGTGRAAGAKERQGLRTGRHQKLRWNETPSVRGRLVNMRERLAAS